MPGSSDSRAVRTASARCSTSAGATAAVVPRRDRPVARWPAAGSGERRLGGHQRVVVSGRQRLGDHRRAVARVEGGRDAVGGAAQVGGDVGHRAAVDLGRGQADDGSAVEDVGSGGGEPHPGARRVQLVQPAQPGEQEVDRPVGVAQPQEHPQALGHRARALGVVLREVPGAAEGLDRTLDVTEAEAQAGGVPEAGPGFVVARELSLDDRLEQLEGPPGVLGGHDARLVAVLARRAVAAAVARLGAPGGELTGRALRVPVCCASRARAACTGRRW